MTFDAFRPCPAPPPSGRVPRDDVGEPSGAGPGSERVAIPAAWESDDEEPVHERLAVGRELGRRRGHRTGPRADGGRDVAPAERDGQDDGRGATGLAEDVVSLDEVTARPPRSGNRTGHIIVNAPEPEGEFTMKIWITIAALATLPLVQGCAAAALGAGGAIAADQVAENDGGNLF